MGIVETPVTFVTATQAEAALWRKGFQPRPIDRADTDENAALGLPPDWWE